MGDLETSNATVRMNGDFSGFGGTNPGTAEVTGAISVNDFQWPSTLGIGMAYTEDQWMVVADVKQVNWADVMDSFRMTFTADATQVDPLATAFGVAGQSMDVEMYQNWENQTVLSIGGAYKVTPDLTLRAGINKSDNPVPDAYLNALFPATIEQHVTVGLGYATGKNSSIDFSMTQASGVENVAGSGVSTEHDQTNWQLMYSQKF
jgi:long-chain fatty acid transport protein